MGVRAQGLLSWPSSTQALAGGVNFSEIRPSTALHVLTWKIKELWDFLHYTQKPRRGSGVLAQTFSLLHCSFSLRFLSNESKAKSPVLSAFPSIYLNHSQDFSLDILLTSGFLCQFLPKSTRLKEVDFSITSISCSRNSPYDIICIPSTLYWERKSITYSNRTC